MALQPGARLGPYEVLDLIGTGGMGEVYRARDTRLDRIVALKVLPAAFCDDLWRRVRFQREAHAISTLNHHRICALYDIGEEDGIPYLVMELLAGESLSAVLQKGPLPIWRALRIGSEIAEGLAAAHRHGIVHRDLKPANVMLTPEGVKLLDFGLAKLAKPESTAPEEPPTGRLDALSQDGFVVGSLPYMAPEQLSGKTVDARTDIWALGVILYEMLAGWRPFSSDSTTGLAAAILERDPESLSAVRRDMPATLERVVAGCLAKNPEDRWYSAHDVAYELSGISTTSPTPLQPAPDGQRWWRRVAARASLARALVVSIAILGGPGDGVPPLRSSLRSAARPVEMTGYATGLLTNPRQVTSAPGWEADPAMSPDGTLIAYVSDESGVPDLWIAAVGGTKALQLTFDTASEQKPCWFPDGRFVAYASDRDDMLAIWKVPVLGGTPVLVVPNASDPAIDPSGTRIAFVSASSLRIAVASLDAPSQENVLTHADDGVWNHRDPAWSPDGRTIVYAAQRGLWTVPASGGDARPLTIDEADEEPAWSNDGRYVYFTSYREGTKAIWRVAAGGGTPERVTLGHGSEGHPSFTLRGSDLVFTTFTRDSKVVIRNVATGAETSLPNARSEFVPTFSHDGTSILFVSDRGGTARIWQQPIAAGRASGEAKALTDHHGIYPTFSPDDRWVAYYRLVPGQPRALWIVSSSGGPPRKLSDSTKQEVYPAWSPDGKEIAFIAQHNGRSELLAVPVRDGKASGPPRLIRAGEGVYETPVWSPDGRSLALAIQGGTDDAAIWIVGTDGHAARRLLTGRAPLRVRWHPLNGRLLVSVPRGSNFELLETNASGGPLRSLRPPVRFGRNPELDDFDISPDGRFLTFCRESSVGDIWMVQLTDS